MSVIKLKKLAGAKTPVQATEHAGAWDISAHRIEMKADDFYIVHTGLFMELELVTKLFLLPRSSLTNTHWVIQNSPGLGDADFVGEYQIRFRAFPTGLIKTEYQYALSYPEFPYKEGDRIAQIMLVDHIGIEFEETKEEFRKTNRGVGSYGHTGL